MHTLKALSELIGISGYEESVRTYIHDYLTDKFFEISTDRIGNLLIHLRGDEKYPHVMIVAHMDEVGFQVMDINDDGSAIVKTLGNIKTWNSINLRVATADRQKKGIVYCENPEGIGAHDFERIVIIPTLGQLQVGDVLGFEAELIETDTQYIGKALDNRISCYALCEVLKNKVECKNELDIVFSVQEEIGMRGARVAVSELEPDIIIDFDVSPVGERNSLKMGKGIGIKLSDSIGVSNLNLVRQIETVANNEGIQYQREVSDCGTSELIITNEKDVGAERIGISIPCQNMHSSVTRVYKEDLEMAVQLISAVIKNGLLL